MKNKINLAIQVLPRSTKKGTYSLVDVAIAEIEKSGLKYKVCPFETVIEGDYDVIMDLVRIIHHKLYEAGTENMMTYMKIQSSFGKDVTIEDKMEKYS